MKNKIKTINNLIMVVLVIALYVGLTSVKFRITATVAQTESTSHLLLRDKWLDENITILNDNETKFEREKLQWLYDENYYEIMQGEHDRVFNTGVVSFCETLWWLATSIIIWLLVMYAIRYIVKVKRKVPYVIDGRCKGRKPSFRAFFRYDFMFRKIIAEENNYILCEKNSILYAEKKVFYTVSMIISLLAAFAINYYFTNQIFMPMGNELTGLLPIDYTLKYLNNCTILVKAFVIYKLLSFRYFFTEFKELDKAKK